MSKTNLSTIKTVLLSSPPGQFDQILNDLDSALHDKTILSEGTFIERVRSDWETSTFRSILSKFEENSHQINNGCVFLLGKAMDKYLCEAFSVSNVRAAHEILPGIDDATITITIYAERIDLQNFQSGSWATRYVISNTTGFIGGSAKIHAHTFENGGNFHLKSDFTMDSIDIGTCPSSAATDDQLLWVSKVVQQIQIWEEKTVMVHLKGMYESIGNMHMKCLRRVLPVTRTKMDWNVLGHRVVKMMGECKKMTS